MILGDIGDDMLFANSAEDYNTILDSDGVTPGTDNDWLNADAGDDLLVGSTGNNGLSGGEGADRIYGGAGNDALFGDQFWLGESTWSMAIVNNPDGSITADFVDARNQTLGEPGPGGNDILIGGAGDDYLEGDRGNDILDGGIGNDFSGGDAIMAGDGDDRLAGGDDNERLMISIDRDAQVIIGECALNDKFLTKRKVVIIRRADYSSRCDRAALDLAA